MKNKRINIFDGSTQPSQYTKHAYNALMTRKWVSNEDVLAESMGLGSTEELPSNVTSLCNAKEYAALKRAFALVRDTLIEQCGKDSVKDNGKSSHGIKWQYVGEEENPLAYMLGEIAYKELNTYLEFCFDSIGFFPHEWLEYFFRNSIDLFEMKNKSRRGDDVISSSLDNALKNKGLLPVLYEHIKNKNVIEFVYEEFKGRTYKVVLHPHYLKEFNGRWAVWGYIQDVKSSNLVERSYPLDRINPNTVSIVQSSDVTYVSAPKDYYKDYFARRIGTSKNKYGDKTEHIRIRTLTKKMHGYVTTKKFIANQKTTIEFGEHEDGTYGEIYFESVINNELMGKILQMGEGLLVVPTEESNTLSGLMADRIERMSSLYKNLNLPKDSQ